MTSKDSIDSIADALDQALHNQSVPKSQRHTEVIKLVLALAMSKDVNLSDIDIAEARILLNGALREISVQLPKVKIGPIELTDDQLESLLAILSKLNMSTEGASPIQDIFMRFGPQFLKKDLDQYFTPKEVVDFMAEVVEYRSGSKVIDPAGGSGDFLVSAHAIATQLEISIALNHWDQSLEASEVAQLNLLMNGVMDAHYKVGDSLAESSDGESTFDVVLTNPPFGTKTIWSEPRPIEAMKQYRLGRKWQNHTPTEELVRQQLGILFIERDLLLLKPGGILAIVVPSGYLTNPSESYVRKYLMEETQILGVVSIPAGTFKKSGAGVTCELLFLKKGPNSSDYPIFTAKARDIGFDFKKANTPKIFRKNPLTGELLKDPNGRHLPQNDLIDIAEKFRSFATEHNIPGLAKMKVGEELVEYASVTKSELQKDSDLVLSPRRYEDKYLEVVRKLNLEGATTLRDIGAEVSISETLSIDPSAEYVYLDIGEVGLGSYKTENSMRGWELPGRARQTLRRNDILVARLEGSTGKFCLISGDQENLICTNGLFRVRILDERKRLTFLQFLHTREYQVQVSALSTGSIMEDVKFDDFLNKLLIPAAIDDAKFAKMKKLTALQAELSSL
jgi:type I restriction enzyme M protein